MPSELSGSYLDVISKYGYSPEIVKEHVENNGVERNKSIIAVDLPRTVFVDGTGGLRADFDKQCQTDKVYAESYHRMPPKNPPNI